MQKRESRAKENTIPETFSAFSETHSDSVYLKNCAERRYVLTAKGLKRWLVAQEKSCLLLRNHDFLFPWVLAFRNRRRSLRRQRDGSCGGLWRCRCWQT